MTIMRVSATTSSSVNCAFEKVEALLRLASTARFGRVHVEAVGAAVDLRGAILHEIREPLLQDAVFEALAEFGANRDQPCVLERMISNRLGSDAVPSEDRRLSEDGGIFLTLARSL